MAGRGQISVQRPTLPPPTPYNQGARAFIDGGRGLRAETAQSALTVILKLVIDGLTNVILVVLSTVTLQFQSICISLRPPGGVSVSTRQLTGHGSEYYLHSS